MEKRTEIDGTLSYIVERLDYNAVNSKHSIKKNGEYGYIIIRDVGDIGYVEYAITSRMIRRMSECESIRDAMIRDIGRELSFAGMMLVSRRARGRGAESLGGHRVRPRPRSSV